ncbi:MAG: O-antigen ligase family protein [Gemmatimonadaceae bacterium]|nr:O-antigen ligase family protein [Gemmatimonadaceae bacterium]
MIGLPVAENARFTDGRDRGVQISSTRLATVAIVGILALSATLLVVTGRPHIGALPVLGGLAALALWSVPIRVPLFAFLGLAILGDITTPVPISPMHPVMRPFYLIRLLLLENLNKFTGIEAFRFSGMEVIILFLVGLFCAHVLVARRDESAGTFSVPRPLMAVLGLAVVSVLAMEVWGIARGGDARQSFWQMRYLLFTPILAALCMYGIRRSTHLVELAAVVTGVACLKIAVGLYVFVWSMTHGHGTPHSVTSHTDTVLFGVVFAIWSGVLLFRASAPRVLVAVPVLLWTMLGIVINNRRTAYVTVAVVLFLLVLLLPRVTRRSVLLGALAFSPLLAGYLLIGRSRSGGVFAPAASIWSVTKQDDASSDSRDVENYNLTLTLRHHLVLGSGFGHKYEEGPASYDLTGVFDQYRYVAHNSVLALMGIGGVFGFALLWLPMVVGTFFAARAHRCATMSIDRIGAFVAIATFAAYQLQAWSDMGVQGWTSSALVAVAYATTALVVRRSGAWSNHGATSGTQPVSVNR